MDEGAKRLACHQFALPNQRFVKALTHFGSATELLAEGSESLSRFFRDKDIHRIQSWKALGSNEQEDQIAAIRQRIKVLDARHVSILDQCYPILLREIPDPPAFLFVRGDTDKLSKPQIAIVGSRKMTPLGGKTAQQFGHRLGQAGIAITSGLALGIDACAHRGALDSGGLTIAVLGTGIDGCYPRSNARLQQEIVSSGGVILSEYPLGTAPVASNFPRRNRIITGLSMATLVVEASEKSGSLVSARLAADQGREVFAIPGNINSPASSGCHKLIREGATLVTEPQHVLEGISSMFGMVMDVETLAADIPATGLPTKDPVDQHWLLGALGSECLSVDELCDRCDKPVQEITSAITELELCGSILASAFGYQRVR